MPSRIPFKPSVNNYQLGIPLDSVLYLFTNIHWNSRENAWYFDLREEDGTSILSGYKVVLGTLGGSFSTHPFFQNYKLDVIDTELSGVDARYDELGKRINVLVTSNTEVLDTTT